MIGAGIVLIVVSAVVEFMPNSNQARNTAISIPVMVIGFGLIIHSIAQ